jgi:catechol 2,3-dioxygenase-like lactoylglutathione lyase family enzyme
MTNEPFPAPEAELNFIAHETAPGRLRFGMIVLYVRDLQRSIAFYRLLGLNVPDPHPEHPVSACEMGKGVTLIITTGALAVRFDPGWVRPERGYQQFMEFFVDDDAQVDAVWNWLTSAGYTGRTAPGPLIGPYATLVEDPDGNVVLITSEPVTDEARSTES